MQSHLLLPCDSALMMAPVVDKALVGDMNNSEDQSVCFFMLPLSLQDMLVTKFNLKSKEQAFGIFLAVCLAFAFSVFGVIVIAWR